MTPLQRAAFDFIKNCNELYPEADLMDDEIQDEYALSWEILQGKNKEPKNLFESSESKQSSMIIKRDSQPRKMGKIAKFEETVLDCLHQGFGEEKQLLEEAEARKNPYARKNYINAYYRAVQRFQRGE